MCGIAGLVLNSRNINGESIVKAMTDAIKHRGPDGVGFWCNEHNNLYLGHRRLSIIDLSISASQPMKVLERYVVIFNGEIYNYLELKEMLTKKGYVFQTLSDTEVLVCMYDYYKENCLDLLDGMFAFVIYDQNENKLFGARDRFGEKPFFYSYTENKEFYFASEIKALWAAGIKREVNENFLFNYLSFGYLQDPNDQGRIFYNNIYKIPPSHYFVFDIEAKNLVIKKYWDIDWHETDESIAEQEAITNLRELLATSVKRRLRSDVPLGSSLSGGIDSSIIVSLLDDIDCNNQIKRKTFSASFPGFAKDEKYYQKLVISETNVDPYFVYPDEDSFLNNFDTILYHQDEPFGSASINIQYEVFKKAKAENVTVLLDGQGADEIFAGYHGYYHAYFDGLKRESVSKYKKEFELYTNLHSDNRINQPIRRNKFNPIKNFLPIAVREKMKTSIVKLPAAKKIFSDEYFGEYRNSIFKLKENFSSLNEALYYSTFKFGLEELLRYADRNSMAHSREVRLPFLNHELVKYVFTLPPHFKIREGWTKWVLRFAYSGLVDEQIIWRKDKIGYEPPQKSWLKNSLFQNKLEESFSRLMGKNILNPKLSLKNIDDGLSWRIALMR